jgi:hypothetical protein
MEPSFITERCEFRVKNTSHTVRKIQSQKCVLLSWSTCVCSIVAIESTNMFHFENGPRGHCAWWKRKGKNITCVGTDRAWPVASPFLGAIAPTNRGRRAWDTRPFPRPENIDDERKWSAWSETYLTIVPQIMTDIGPSSRRHRIKRNTAVQWQELLRRVWRVLCPK